MSRFSPYLGIVAALAVGVLLGFFSGGTAVVRAPETVSVPEFTTSLSSIESATTAASAQSAPVAVAVPLEQSSVVSVTPSISLQPSISAAELDAKLNATATTLRSALVNIICSAPAGSAVHSMSGSGVIIDSKGIIITNAHIAQYFLLADRGVSCVIRSGSPAVNAYNANLMYISPTWLRSNANVLTETLPNGTGEYDFALLAISKSATSATIPSSFPSIPLAVLQSSADTPVVIASYGAQFLQSSQITSELFPTIVFGSTKEVFTFGTNTIDVLALGGSVAAQEGSSGGGVADVSGELVGMITTSTVTGATDTRSLNAISASYIRAEYANETGQAIDLLLKEDTTTAVSDFSSRISELESIITAKLP